MCESITTYTPLKRRAHKAITFVTYEKSIKYDPTRTAAIRNAFVKEMTRRFDEIAKAIYEAVVVQDVFGLAKQTDAPLVNVVSAPGKHAFDFARPADKVTAFNSWFTTMAGDVMGVGSANQLGTGVESAWTNTYLTDSYERGILRARYEMGAAELQVPSLDATGGMVASMNTPFHIDRVGLIYSRAYENLKGITAEMSSKISTILSISMANGDGPKRMARKMIGYVKATTGKDLGITDSLGRVIPAKRRAVTLARTEVIRAHHVAMIQEYKNWGLAGVNVQAEWTTGGDGRVCKQCSELEGKVFTLAEIEPLIPRHPNCRCIALPMVESITPGKKTPTTPGKSTTTPKIPSGKQAAASEKEIALKESLALHEKETIEDLQKILADEFNMTFPKGLTPREVNDGWSDYYVEAFTNRYGGARQWQTEITDAGNNFEHSWIKLGNKYYDAEAFQGVDNYLDLPFFVRAKKLNPSLTDDYIKSVRNKSTYVKKGKLTHPLDSKTLSVIPPEAPSMTAPVGTPTPPVIAETLENLPSKYAKTPEIVEKQTNIKSVDKYIKKDTERLAAVQLEIEQAELAVNSVRNKVTATKDALNEAKAALKESAKKGSAHSTGVYYEMDAGLQWDALQVRAADGKLSLAVSRADFIRVSKKRCKGFNFKQWFDDIDAVVDTKIKSKYPSTKVNARIGLQGDDLTIRYNVIDPTTYDDIMSISRYFKTIDGANGVDHSYFQLAKPLQKKTGIGRDVISIMDKQYQHSDIRFVNVHANIDVGGYAWGRYGFNSSASSMRSLVTNAKKLDQAAKNQLYKIIDDWQIANPSKAYDQYAFPVDLIASTKHGKDALLKTHWYGQLDLTNNLQTQKFRNYLYPDNELTAKIAKLQLEYDDLTKQVSKALTKLDTLTTDQKNLQYYATENLKRKARFQKELDDAVKKAWDTKKVDDVIAAKAAAEAAAKKAATEAAKAAAISKAAGAGKVVKNPGKYVGRYKPKNKVIPVADRFIDPEDAKYYKAKFQEYQAFFDDIEKNIMSNKKHPLHKQAHLFFNTHGDDYSNISTQVRDFRNYLRIKFDDGFYQAFESWQSSTHHDLPMKMKYVAHKLEKQLNDSFIVPDSSAWRDTQLIDNFVRQTEREFDSLKQSYINTRAFNQAYLEMRKIKSMQLYRGTDGPTGEKIRDYLFAEGMRKTTHSITDANLTGFSRSVKVANRFGIDKGGVTVTKKVMAEDIILSDDLGYKLTCMFENEMELIISGGKTTYKLDDIYYSYSVPRKWNK